MSETTELRFDLRTEPWIRVLDLDGRPRECSLLDVFDEAPRLRGLVGDVPTQDFAIIRLLLAVTHRALAGPRSADDWSDLWQRQEVPQDAIRDYLERWADRFDLIHPDLPFMQVADLRTAKDETFGLQRIIADVPNGAPFLTTRQRRGVAEVSTAEAARWLVHSHAFDVSGIKSGAVGDDRVKGGKGYPIGTGWAGTLGGVLAEGDTLMQTLLLNLVPFDYGDGADLDHASDRPVWERPPLDPGVESADRVPTGPVDLYTWPSRRIRLVGDPHRVRAVLICNGDPLAPRDRMAVEPMTAWRRSQAQEKKLGKPLVYMPREHRSDRAFWRGLAALLAPRERSATGGDAAPNLQPMTFGWLARAVEDELLPAGFLIRARAIGMEYATQQAAVGEIIDDAMVVPAALLDPDRLGLRMAAERAVTAAEEGASAVAQLAGNLAQAAGGEAEGPSSRARERAYDDLGPAFRAWVSALRPDIAPDRAAKEWHEQVWRAVVALGVELVRDCPPAGWRGRQVRGRQVNVAAADLWFRRKLRASLPLAFVEGDDS